MSIVNRTRKDVNDRHHSAHHLMQQAVTLNTIIQSPEYINCHTIDKAYVNSIAKNIVNDFQAAVANLNLLDAQLNQYNTRQLNQFDHTGLLGLDQQYIAWGDHFSQNITPSICALVEYIQSHFGVVA